MANSCVCISNGAPSALVAWMIASSLCVPMGLGCVCDEHKDAEYALRTYVCAVRDRDYERIEESVVPGWREPVGDILRAHREFASSAKLLRADVTEQFGKDMSEVFCQEFYRPFDRMLLEVLLWPQWNKEADIDTEGGDIGPIAVVFEGMETGLQLESWDSRWGIAFDNNLKDIDMAARGYSGMYRRLTRTFCDIRQGMSDGRVTDSNVGAIVSGSERVPPKQ